MRVATWNVQWATACSSSSTSSWGVAGADLADDGFDDPLHHRAGLFARYAELLRNPQPRLCRHETADRGGDSKLLALVEFGKSLRQGLAHFARVGLGASGEAARIGIENRLGLNVT